MDPIANVRRMCGIVGCEWLMNLRDRYSFFDRIIPLILCWYACFIPFLLKFFSLSSTCVFLFLHFLLLIIFFVHSIMFCSLNDEIIEIREEINELFIECGNKYFQENEKELQKLELLEAELPCSAYSETVSKIRPTIGCRAIIQRSLRMVNIVVRELIDWQENVRLHSLKLLWQFILHAEKAITSKFIDIFPALSKCCQDDEKFVVKEAQRVAFLMGQLLNFDDWLSNALKILEKYPTNIGTICCFSHLYAGASNESKSMSVNTITKLISTTDICCNTKSSYQSALLNLIEHLIDIYLEKMRPNDNSVELTTQACAVDEKYLFDIIVRTTASTYAHDDYEITERAIKIYEKFCGEYENRIALQAKYGANILNENIDNLDCECSEQSESIIMLYGYLTLFGFQAQFSNDMITAIKLVMKNGTSNAKVKILAGMSSV